MSLDESRFNTGDTFETIRTLHEHIAPDMNPDSNAQKRPQRAGNCLSTSSTEAGPSNDLTLTGVPNKDPELAPVTLLSPAAEGVVAAASAGADESEVALVALAGVGPNPNTARFVIPCRCGNSSSDNASNEAVRSNPNPSPNPSPNPEVLVPVLLLLLLLLLLALLPACGREAAELLLPRAAC